MSYIDYQKTLGLDVTLAEKNPHIDFSWGKGDDKFQVYGTVYLVEGKPYMVHTYEWDTGPYEAGSEIAKRITEMGYPCEIDLSKGGGGNGHYTYYFK